MDTFLNLDYYTSLVNEINSTLDKVRNSKHKLKEIKKKFEYKSIFNVQGAQGITGLLNFKGSKKEEDIVFKLSAEVDRAIEHEYIITTELNNLRKLCPHFMSCFNMICLPISNSFIEENRESDNEDDSEDDSEDVSEDVSEDDTDESDDSKNKCEDTLNEDINKEIHISRFGKYLLVKLVNMSNKRFWEEELMDFYPMWRGDKKGWLIDGKHKSELYDFLGLNEDEPMSLKTNKNKLPMVSKGENKSKEDKSIVPENKKVGLFDQDKDNLPTNVLLLEYVSNISFHHISKYSDKKTILSNVFMILLALQIAQNKNNFTHYDLHTDNILIRQVEEDSYFCYKFNTKEGEKFELIPTFGFFPVLIDMGSSYIKQLEGKSMYTDPTNYSYGLQPTVFDSIADLHHFLLCAFYYLQDKSDEFYFINHRIMNIFKHLNVYRKKGWKRLPVNIMKPLVNYLISSHEEIENDKLFEKYDTELLEILSYSIILPWENLVENIETEENKKIFKTNIIQFISEMNVFDNLDFLNDFDFFFILREIIDVINEYRKEIIDEMNKESDLNVKLSKKEEKKKNNSSVYKKVENDIKQKISFLIDEKFPKINFPNLINSIIVISRYMSSIYKESISKNLEVMNESYKKINVKEPYDIYQILKQNTSCRNKFTSTTKLYIMDSINEKRSEIILNQILDEKELKEINGMRNIKQRDMIERKLNIF